MFPHPRQLGILLSRKENPDPPKSPVSRRPREAAGPGERPGVRRSAPIIIGKKVARSWAPWRSASPGPERSLVTPSLHTGLHLPGGLPLRVLSPHSHPAPLHKRVVRGPKAKESVSQGLADEPCQVQELNHGHKPAQAGSEGKVGMEGTHHSGRGVGTWWPAPLSRLHPHPPSSRGPSCPESPELQHPSFPAVLRAAAGKRQGGPAAGSRRQSQPRGGLACTLRPAEGLLESEMEQ